MIKADLHVHSSLSDGSQTREEIIREAAKKGITHLAFTEHDMLEYIEEALLLGKKYDVCIIPGLEISAFDKSSGHKVHILGYGCKDREAIRRFCAPTLEQRQENCLKQIRVLKKLGYYITPEKVMEYADKTIYKQHILKYLLDTRQSEAMFGKVYREIFKNGGPCDFDISYVDARDAVEAVKQAGGVPVLAHPGQQDNYYLVKELASRGLMGIEYSHPSHNAIDRERVRALACKCKLICTGGSDYHGAYQKETVELGSLSAPAEDTLILERLVFGDRTQFY